MTQSKQRPATVLAYLRVSTEEQSQSGLGLAAQRHAIETEAQRRGWADIVWLQDAGYSARTLDRPALSEALEALRSGSASCLVVSRLDRLSRSLLDFCGLVDLAHRERWSLLALDLGLDLDTPSGRLTAHVLASMAEFERELISARTSAAMQARKRAGQRLGRPPVLDPATRERILSERGQGVSYSRIAAMLTSEQVPTAHGGQWWPATVRTILKAA